MTSIDPSPVPAPLYDEAEFAAAVRRMVNDHAPSLFAVVQEYGTRADARIAAWGTDFGDHVEVVGVDQGDRLSLGSAGNALPWFQAGPQVRARLVWVDRNSA